MKVIFVNYVPGSFGSFLYHCIAESPAGYKKKTDVNIFDVNGAAHKNIVTMIYKFHDGDELRVWSGLSDKQKQEYIDKFTYCPEDFYDSNKWYIHRLTIPSMTPEVMRFFPTSKFINITFSDDDICSIARNMTNKTFDQPPGEGWIHKMRDNHPIFYNQLLKCSEEEVLDIYYQSNLTYVKDHQFNDTVPDVYAFPYKNFLIENSFIDEYNKLSYWLGIDPTDVKQLYSEFKKANNL